MKCYRLRVSYQQRAWCVIDTDVTWAQEVMADLTAKFPAEAGYSLQCFTADEERRILDISSSEITVLARLPLFKET